MTALAIIAGLGAYLWFASIVGRFLGGNVSEPRRRRVDHHPHQDMPRDVHLRLHRQVPHARMVDGSSHTQRNRTEVR